MMRAGGMGAARPRDHAGRTAEPVRLQHDRLPRLTIDDLDVGIVVLDAAMEVVMANRSAARLLGLADERAMVGRSALNGELTTLRGDGSQMPAHESPAVVAARTGRTTEGVVGVTAAGGALRWLRVVARPLRSSAAESPALVLATLSDVTSLERADQELRRNEARFRSLASSSPLGVFLADGAGHARYVNPRLEAITGRRIQPGQLFAQAVHPDDRRAAVAAWRAAVSRRQPYAADFRVLTPEGEVRWVEVSAGPTPASNGEAEYVGCVVDITRRKRVEHELQAAERLFREGFAGAPVGMAMADLEGRFVEVNPALCRMLRRSRDQLVGMSFAALTHPDDLDEVDLGRRRLLAGEIPALHLEQRYVLPDGEPSWAAVGVSVIRDLHGRPRQLVIQAHDIHERKRAEAQLQQSEQRLQAIVDNSGLAVYVKDLLGRYELANQTAGDLAGLAPSQMLGRTDHELLPAELADLFRQTDEAARRAGRPLRFEDTFSTPDGERAHITVKFPLTDASGEPYAIGGITTDITDRLRQEREREQLEARLAQAQRLESLGLLAGGIAHDFNNLLAVIGNNAAFAAQALGETGPASEEVSEIRAATERAGRLVQQLMIFSRREAVRTEVLDLGAVLEELEGLLRRTLGEHIQLHLELPPDPWPVEADRGQLEQIVLNLAVNGRDAMPDGGRLEIRVANMKVTERELATRPDVSPGPHLRLSVTDTGCGMDAETARRAFEPFFTTKGKGTGLGLATVWGAASRAGGFVDIDSRPGEGTTVNVHLPAAARPARSRPVAADRPPEGAGQTVLVVEDEPALSRVTARMLSASGYRVVEARNAEAALLLCQDRRRQIDLLLTDVVMPGMSGTSLAGAARELRPGLPVLYISGHTSEVIGLNGAGNGDFPLLTKPFDHHALLTAVSAAIGDRSP